LHDRVIFRELFPIGLTALDPIEMAVQNNGLTSSQLSGRREIETLVQTLRLPVHQPGMQHIEARHQWYEGASRIFIAISRQAAISATQRVSSMRMRRRQ
jgi:chromosome partitioning protein